MPTVTVAGGSGHVGRTIVEVLGASKEHEVLVLGRSVPEKNKLDQPFVVVDYDDVEATAALLKTRGVHTIISAIVIIDPSSSSSQVNKVRAAALSGTVRRFITSEWSVPHSEDSALYVFREAAVEALRETNLQWTRIVNGYFLDYYGLPYLKSYLTPFKFAVDIANKAAAIPGTGNDIVYFTYTFHVAKFVVALLGLSDWDETTYCYGDKATWNEILQLAEESRGSKFTVSYDALDKLQKGEVTELPSHRESYGFFPKPALRGFLSLLGRYVVEGRFDIPADKALNAKFTEMQTLKVKEAIELWRDH
ncbi:Oxidoreductase BOA1 [Fusarium oxysporum f. sp. cubense]|uniref:Oxidoreductase BOA1 n=1 Tax=Fusarium oxysporum f. sp. cubense TaxID=61366 RepID=A0A559LDE1_FUSOC|nr:Oxidoreductase BOA1 [Fusarium oxysporum f. sp. cubense]